MAIFATSCDSRRSSLDVASMSRGGLMLRCAMDRKELSYVAIAGAIVNGKRPPETRSAELCCTVAVHALPEALACANGAVS